MGQANVKRWAPEILPLLADGDPLGAETFHTHKLPLAEGPAAYETFQKKEDGGEDPPGAVTRGRSGARRAEPRSAAAARRPAECDQRGRDEHEQPRRAGVAPSAARRRR
jgi:hypothetical protein